MPIEPVLCVSTDLDALQLSDLRTRFASVMQRASDPAATATPTGINDGLEIRSPDGKVSIHSIRDVLVIKAGPSGDLGPSSFEMPLPAALASADHQNRPIAAGGLAGVMEHLSLWRACITAPKASTVEHLRIADSGFSRLLAMVGAIVQGANPGMKPRARVNFRCAAPYETAPGIMGGPPPAHLGVIAQGSTKAKPILRADLTDRLLDLHRGLALESNGNRGYRLRHLPPMQASLSPAGIVDAMRWAAELGVRPDARVVLKAGMDL